MALDLSGLTAYVEENKAELITKAILGAKTLGLPGIDIMQNVKSSEKIPVIESTVPYQSGLTCGVTTSGTTSITQIQISTSPIKFAEEICLKTLEAYYTQKYLPKGQNFDTTSIASDIINRKLANIVKQNESMIWQGKTTYTNSTVLKQINGWLSTIDTAGTAVAATQQASISASTVMGIFEDIFSKVPAASRQKEVVAFCGMDTFVILTNKLTSTYGYYGHFTQADNAWGSWSLLYPGTNMRIVAVPGLNNDNAVDTGALPTAVKNRIIATYTDNLVFGTDLIGDSATIESWYSKDDRTLKFYGEFRAGTQVKFIDHVVQYTNS